ncbi:MAG TPA: hypothetical protein VIK34_02720 [Clostridiaceae bacterium]
MSKKIYDPDETGLIDTGEEEIKEASYKELAMFLATIYMRDEGGILDNV